MKKILRYSLVVLFALVGTSAMADDVVIDFNSMDLATSHDAVKDGDGNVIEEASTAGDITSDQTITVSGVKVTISVNDPEVSKNPNRFWQTNNGPQLRCYSGTITIEASKNMKSIKFAAPSKFNLTCTDGSIDSKTWTGNAKKVVFTVAGNTQINKITIGFEEAPQPTLKEVNVAQALADCEALADNETSFDNYKVTGYVVGDPDFQRNSDNELYGNVNLTIADEVGGTSLLTIYRALKDAAGTKFGEEDLTIMKAGDKVVFQGKLKKYVNKSGVTTLELVDGYLVSVSAGINAATIDNDPNAPMYNLKGERVDQNYRGVVIQNGHKKIQK